VAVPPAAADPAAAAGANAWPPPDETLEKWMMNTVKEGDPAARFLRTMLRMNPAYGAYLQTDSDLVNVVQMFSKRIKTKISQFESPAHIPPQALTQPLCEMLWRVVGYVMHGVVELEEEANMPVPKEASGMIKMLLHTNSSLSNKLNELRRVYLKELSGHRDKARRISDTAARAVENLKEQPIMFFEPLEFILDDTTKDFVRESVVERLKLEMRNAFQTNDDNAEVTKYIEELEEANEALKEEVKTCRATINRLENQNQTIGDREKKQAEELRNQKQQNEEKTKLLAELEAKVKQMEDDINKKNARIEHLEGKLGEAPTVITETVKEIQYADNSEEMEEISSKMLALEAENKRLSDENARIAKELADATALLESGGNIVYQEDPETKKLLDQALKVERELRAANEALEKALAELETEAANLRDELGKKAVARKEVPTAPKKEAASGASDSEVNARIEKELKKVHAEHQKEIQKMQATIDKLTKQIAELTAKVNELEEELHAHPKEKKAKVVKQIGVPEEEHTKLKVKCYEQEQQIEKMEDEYALLEQKCNMLMEKLREKFSDAEMGGILDKIKLSAPPIKKKRKKKAYERLYDDAQRRILELKMRQEKIRALEEQSLKKMARVVASSRDARKVEMLSHLQKANQAGADRFHEALLNFQQSKARRGEATGLEEPFDSDNDEVSQLRSHFVSELEDVTLQCFKDGVCPRCAFSALASFKLHQQGAQPKSFQGGALGGGGSSSEMPWNPQSSSGRGRPRSTASGSGSPSPTGRGLISLGSGPIGSGPHPGAMPYDAAFPMPAPPWRQSPSASEHNQPDFGMSASNASLGSSGPSLLMRASTDNVSSSRRGGGADGDEGRSLVAAMQVGAGGMAPPWRRARSDSPLGVEGKSNRSPSPGPRPPMGASYPRQGGMVPMPSYGRHGPAGPNFEPPPVPGRLPAAQTMALDPIARPVQGAKDFSPGHGHRDRSTSSDTTRERTRSHTDGHARRMRAVSGEAGKQFEEDLNRPTSEPTSFGIAKPRSAEVRPVASHASTVMNFGGGGVGTAYRNIGPPTLPTMPSSRSVPILAAPGPAPWQTAELPWETGAAAKRLSKPARKEMTGPTGIGGFVVTAAQSQESLRHGAGFL